MAFDALSISCTLLQAIGENVLSFVVVYATLGVAFLEYEVLISNYSLKEYEGDN